MWCSDVIKWYRDSQLARNCLQPKAYPSYLIMWAEITCAAVECLYIIEVLVGNYLGRPSEIRIMGQRRISVCKRSAFPSTVESCWEAVTLPGTLRSHSSGVT